MNNTPTLKQIMLRTQFILIPAFLGGFLGSDLLKGSIQTSKLVAGIVIYGVINLFVYLILKSQIKNS